MKLGIEALIFTVIFEIYLTVLALIQGKIRQAYKYPPEVINAVKERGMITDSRLWEISRINKVIGFSILLVMNFVIIYVINKETRFGFAFLQSLLFMSVLTFVDLIGVRLIWMCRTDFWVIPGTEDIKAAYHNVAYYLKGAKWMAAGAFTVALISAGIVALITKLKGM